VIDRFWRMQRLQLESVADILSSGELAQVVEAMELLSAALERHASEQDRRADTGPLAVRA
jgi:hypothetical protein